MKRIVLAMVLGLCPLFAVAQDAKPQLYLIHEEIAKPSMLMQYESTTREVLTALTEKKADPAVFGMRLYMTPDFHYVYVVPISGYAAMDKMGEAWKMIGDQIGKDRWSDLMMRANAPMASYNETIVKLRPDLSYWPANPRVKMEDERFFNWQFYYLMPGKEEDAEALAKDYIALFKAKKINDPFTVFIAQSGNDLPLLVVSTAGTSAADYYAADEKNMAMLGNDAMPLQARAMAITRKFEIREAMLRPDLSYPMPQQKMANK